MDFTNVVLNLTEEDVWIEIGEVKQGMARNANVDINSLSVHLMEKYKMPDNEKVHKVLKYQLKQHKIYGEKRQPTKPVVLSFENTGEEECQPSSTKRRKSCKLLTKKWQKERTDGLVDKIEKLVEEEKKVCTDDEERMSMSI